jgi:hypothetical protein
MAIQVQGNSGVVAEVDGTTFRALRVTIRPVNYGSLGIYRIGAQSGTMSASLAGGAEMFQFRWTEASNLALIYQVSISAGANVAASAAALVSFAMTVARSWSADGSGGTSVLPTGNSNKLRTNMGTTLADAIRISTTGGLTAGTKTLDGQNLGEITMGIGTGAITTSASLNLLPQSYLLDADGEGFMPLVLTQDEGFVVRNGATAWPAGMTWAFGVSAVWAEVASF